MPEYKLRIVLEAVAKNQDDLKKAKENLEGIKGSGASAGGELQKLMGGWAGNVLGMGWFVAAGKMVIDQLKASVLAYAEEELALAKRDAIFESTNGQTRTSIDLLDQQAAALMQLTSVDDDVIIGAQEMALQFRSLSGTEIPKLIATAIGMAGGFRGDVIGTTERLGRMLEMVGQGADGATSAISLLRRQNIILDPAVRENIINLAGLGKTAEAQAALLDALSFNIDRATAAAQTLTGQWELTKNNAENLQEVIGGALTPEIERQLKWINQSIVGWQQYIEVMQLAGELEAAEPTAAPVARPMRGASDEEVAAWQDAQGAQRDYVTEARVLLGAQKDERDGSDELADQIDFEAAATRKLTAEKSLLAGALSGDIENAITQHGETLTKLEAEETQLAAKLVEVTTKYGDQSQEVKDVNSAIRENASAQDKANGAMQRSIALTMYKQAAQHLDMTGQLELGRTMGLISEKDYAVLKAVEDITDAFDKNADGIVAADEDAQGYIKTLGDLLVKLQNLPPETWITVVTEYVTIGTPPNIPGAGETTTAPAPPPPGSYTPMAGGGVLSGPEAGYFVPTMFHGTEGIVPLEDGSIPVRILGGGGPSFSGATINLSMPNGANMMADIYQALLSAGGSPS